MKVDAIFRLPQTQLPDCSQLSHPKYRPDIDGLRAIAVLSVLFFHAMPTQFKGGFVGVDIFFVISGFLISSIIYGNLEAGTFSFRQFYVRRIKRIFPALFCVLFTALLFGWFVLLPTEYAQLGKHAAAGAGFVSNFILMKESGYFDTHGTVKPLLHLWSLGIEEQFYIVWPILLWGAWKKRLNLLSIALLVGFASFWINVIWTKSSPVAAFYSPQTRFWELLIGATLAWCVYYKPPALTMLSKYVDYYLRKIIYAERGTEHEPSIANVLSVSGGILIAIALTTITKNESFPGWYATLPTLGAVCLISAGPQAWVNRVLLSNRVLVWFGLISFPLYLWHWPLLSFSHIFEGENLSIRTVLICIVLSIILAWLTYRFLERPIRHDNLSATKGIVLVSLMCIVGYAGYNCFKRGGLEFRISNFQKITKAQNEWDFPGRLASIELNGVTVYSQPSGLRETTLFIGDSNLEQYYPRIEELIKANPSTTNTALFMSRGGCLPIPNTRSKLEAFCENMMANSLKLALENPDIKRVVIVAQWYGYLYGNGIHFEGNGERLEISLGNAGYDKALAALSSFIDELTAHKKEVTLVLNIPIGLQLAPDYIAKRSIRSFPNVFEVRDGGLILSEFEKAFSKIKVDLSRIALQRKIQIIDPVQFLCKDDRCPSVAADGEPIYKDMGHLRPSFVRSHAGFIDATVVH